MGDENEISKFFLNNTQNRNDESILTSNFLYELDRFYSDENGDRILSEEFVNIYNENNIIINDENLENNSHNPSLFLNNTQSELYRFYCDNSGDNIVNEAYSTFIDESNENINLQNDQDDVSFELFL